MSGTGRNLGAVVKKQVESNKANSKPQVAKNVKDAKDKAGQKKKGISLTLKHQNINSVSELLREFNYKNNCNISVSELVDSLIELSVNSPELEKNLKKKI